MQKALLFLTFLCVAYQACAESFKVESGSIHMPDATPYQWTAVWGISSSQTQDYLSQWSSSGYQPVHIEGFYVSGSVYFAMIAEKKPGAWSAQFNISGTVFNATNAQYVANGYHLVRISAYQDMFGNQLFAGVWSTSGFTTGVRYYVGLGLSDLMYLEQTMSSQGWWPTQIEMYTLSSSATMVYAAIFNQQQPGDPAWQAQHFLPAASYQADISSFSQKGYRVYQVAAATWRNSPYYGAIWTLPQQSQAWQTSYAITTQQLQSLGAQWSSQGYQFTDIQGYANPNGGVLYSAVWDQVGL